jgi:U3 small nucleolar ribonucleoprotein protein IMP4
MTVVTTSRKPLPPVRSLARDMAFAIGAEYVTRGKAGLGDLFALDASVVIVSKSGSFFLVQIFSNEEPVTEFAVRSFAVEARSGAIARGLFVSDRPLYEALSDQFNVAFAGEALPAHRIVFDGTQRKRYTLEIVP